MVDSILTNMGSMIALQNLQATQQNMLQVQSQISTGLKVQTAKDNAATWTIATQMNSDISNLQSVSNGLGNADSALTFAVSGANQITSLISQIRSKVTDAQATGTDPNAVQGDINQLVSQINSTVAASSYNGVNLLQGTVLNAVSSVTTGGNSSPSYITVGGTSSNLGTDAASGGQLSMLNNINVVSNPNAVISGNGGTLTIGSSATDTKSLNLGDTLNFAYGISGSGPSGTVTLKVTNDASGTVLSSSGGNYVVAINAAQVTVGGTSGPANDGVLAGNIVNVLTGGTGAAWTSGTSPFATTPVSGTSAGAAAGTGTTANVITITPDGTGGTASATSTTGGYASMLSSLDKANTIVTTAAAAFGSTQNRVEMQQTFINSLVSTLQGSVGNMVDTDMAAASARLTALQTQQQLGTQALSIANQSSQSILSLFR